MPNELARRRLSEVAEEINQEIGNADDSWRDAVGHTVHAVCPKKRAGDSVRLKVIDDGRGARRSGRRQTESLGMGLSGLAERVALIGGTLRVDSQASGTCVVAEIPALPRASRGRKRKR